MNDWDPRPLEDSKLTTWNVGAHRKERWIELDHQCHDRSFHTILVTENDLKAMIEALKPTKTEDPVAPEKGSTAP